MLLRILSCRDAAKIILNRLSMKDHVNLANVIPDEYMYYLYTAVRKRLLILMAIFDRVSLEKFNDQTLDCLNKRYWRYISRFAKMKENFIIKWSHKINFMLLRQNAYRRRYKHYVSIPRPFSRRFHTLFPGFKYYRPCHWCWVDTQWFQDIDVSILIDMRIYNLFHKRWGIGKRSTYECRYSDEWYSSKKMFKFWEQNSIWFCMTCWEYLEETSAFTSAGPMSPVWLHNTEQRTLLLMHLTELKHKCMGVVDYVTYAVAQRYAKM